MIADLMFVTTLIICSFFFQADGNKRYYASLVHKNWYDGRSLCNRYNMNYATVGSSSEANFMFNNISIHVWIGVSDIGQEGVFKNSHDGSIVTSMLNWKAGQPDDDNNEDCVRMEKIGFNDLNCELFARVLCEIEVNINTEIVENLVEVEPPSNLFDQVGFSGN